MSDNSVERLSDLMELRELNAFYHDKDIERGLLKLASILGRPEIEPTKVAKHVVECDALATLYALKAKYYMTIGKEEPDAREKKNLCLTMREEFHALAQSLKYMVKAQI